MKKFEIWKKLSKTCLHKENVGAKKATHVVVWRENDKPSKTVAGKMLFKVTTSRLGGEVAPSGSNIDGSLS